MPAIVYRFYDENSFGVNDAEGFVASQCTHLQGGYPKALKAHDPLLFMYMENHLNKNPVASPFISVSIGLFWVFRMGLKSLSRGNKFPRIAVIDGQKAARGNKAYFVPPYHRELMAKKVFTDGAWHYGGSHEWVIWTDIPKEAVLHDVSMQELQARVDRLPAVARAFRLDVVGTTRPMSNTRLRDYLKKNQTTLGSALTMDIARLLIGFGVDVWTLERTPMIAKMVSDIVQGWQIAIEADSPERWKRHASLFAFVLTEGTSNGNTKVDEERFQAIEQAFLYGIGSGLGDANWQKNQTLTRRMQKRAKNVGLDMDVHRQGRLLIAVEIPVTRRLTQYRYSGDD